MRFAFVRSQPVDWSWKVFLSIMLVLKRLNAKKTKETLMTLSFQIRHKIVKSALIVLFRFIKKNPISDLISTLISDRCKHPTVQHFAKGAKLQDEKSKSELNRKTSKKM